MDIRKHQDEGQTSSALLAHGRELLDRGATGEALDCLRAAHEADREHAQLRSYYGLCLALHERRYREGLDLCQAALKQEFFNPDLYLNVARLNLTFGFKVEGLRFLRRAQMIDPENDRVGCVLRELGYRSAPVLRFLPRGHMLNRWLGSARHLLTRSERLLESVDHVEELTV